MDVSGRFFSKLRSLAITLEAETARLQEEHRNPRNGNTEGALRVLHELCTEIKSLKGKVQDELACWTAEEKSMRAFIQTCLVVKQRTTEDLHRIQRHCQKYGYRPPDSTANPAKVKGAKEDSKISEAEEDEDGGAEEQEEVEEGNEEEIGATEQPLECKTPTAPPPPAADPMRTPRLSDFGLSAFDLVASVGALSLGFCPTVSIKTPALPDPPKMPKTPKCALQMDEDAPTPRLEDFGISEYTTCFNNDFTMELLRKQHTVCRDTAVPVNPDTVQKEASCPTAVTSASLTPSHEALELDSPRVPDFCTPVLKVNQMQTPYCPPDDSCSRTLQLSPELPVFETPYVKKLMSTVKSTKKMDSTTTEEKSCQSLEPAPNGDAAHDDTCSCDVPSMLARPLLSDEAMPEMPSLEMFPNGSVLPVNLTKGGKEGSERVPEISFVLKQPRLPDLEGHMEEWTLPSSPVQSRHILDLPETQTPKMPDVSQFTQDIIKLLSQSNTPAPATGPTPKSTVLQSTAATNGKENRVQVLAAVSEDEFAALPGYLRQMPLSSLNQAIGKISSAAVDKQQAGTTQPIYFPMEELRKITGTGVKAHLYFLCLTELRRLEQVQDKGSSIMFRVLS